MLGDSVKGGDSLMKGWGRMAPRGLRGMGNIKHSWNSTFEVIRFVLIVLRVQVGYLDSRVLL